MRHPSDPFENPSVDHYRGVEILWTFRIDSRGGVADFKVTPSTSTVWKPSGLDQVQKLGTVSEIWATRRCRDVEEAHAWVITESHAFIDLQLDATHDEWKEASEVRVLPAQSGAVQSHYVKPVPVPYSPIFVPPWELD